MYVEGNEIREGGRDSSSDADYGKWEEKQPVSQILLSIGLATYERITVLEQL
jgi:hypothetical protein